jgi:hypothetical protein
LFAASPVIPRFQTSGCIREWSVICAHAHVRNWGRSGLSAVSPLLRSLTRNGPSRSSDR